MIEVLLGLGRAIFVVMFGMNVAVICTWVDRRQGALIQDRVGPDRAVVWLPTVVARALAVLPALGAAAAVAFLAVQDKQARGEDPVSMGRAFLFSELAVLMTWITLALGYGQDAPSSVGRGVGVNAYRLRDADAAWSRDSTVRVTEREEELAITQDHASTRARPLALLATLADYRHSPDLTAHLRGPRPSLLPVVQAQAGPQWAMTIDTSICTGCSACVIACQSENNVPVVGKEGVARGREMHWLRIDRYFFGDDAAPRVVHQPMLCQHCEAAPCEYVCPVNATVHSPDGLNEMVYNRCIGTRFCSNNCPYKVRRFNYFEYTGLHTTEQLARNPDVSVRERGVMEKCTFCVQRIRQSEMQARIERRELGPGEVRSACQQACPTGAIQFGALEHAGTPMVEWRKEGRAYAALHDLGTRPRTQYLAKLENPNPELGR